MTSSKEGRVPLATVLRSHGVRGEVRVRPFNPAGETLFRQKAFELDLPAGGSRTLHVESMRQANDALLVKFRDVDDRDQADALRGANVVVARRDLAEPEAGEFYACDVEGASVLLNGKTIGVVLALRSYPTVDVLVVRVPDAKEPMEVPLTDGYVREVSPERREVVLHTLDGVL